MQIGIWTRSHEEHLQKLLISQHLYPLVSKSSKSLHALNPALGLVEFSEAKTFPL